MTTDVTTILYPTSCDLYSLFKNTGVVPATNLPNTAQNTYEILQNTCKVFGYVAVPTKYKDNTFECIVLPWDDDRVTLATLNANVCHYLNKTEGWVVQTEHACARQKRKVSFTTQHARLLTVHMYGERCVDARA